MVTAFFVGACTCWDAHFESLDVERSLGWDSKNGFPGFSRVR
jgi:hypothetical protein